MIGTTFPKMMIQNPVSTTYPSYFRCMGMTDVSLSTGFDRLISLRAAGETIERLFSYSNDFSGKIINRDDLTKDTIDWLTRIERDVGYKETFNSLQFITAKDVCTGQLLLAPEVAFTLAKHPNDELMPWRDSSGCAIHKTQSLAVKTAIAECIERQCLSLFWYFGHCQSAWVAESLEAFLSPRAMEMILSLQAVGKILFFDISAVESYYTLLAVFLDEEGEIKFSAGASSSQCFATAAEKSAIELYQAFTLMQHLYSISISDDAHLLKDKELSNGYLQHNSSSSVAIFWNYFSSFSNKLEPANISAERYIDLKRLKLVAHEKCLRFGFPYPELHFCSLLSLAGFPTMTQPEKYLSSFEFAGSLFGYSRIIRQGDIPFG